MSFADTIPIIFIVIFVFSAVMYTVLGTFEPKPARKPKCRATPERPERFTSEGRAQLRHIFVMQALHHDQVTLELSPPSYLSSSSNSSNFPIEHLRVVELRLEEDYYESHAEQMVEALERNVVLACLPQYHQTPGLDQEIALASKES